MSEPREITRYDVGLTVAAATDIDEDLKRLILTAVDLAAYRKIPIADDLARSVAFELQDRVSKLPEVVALRDEEEGMMEPGSELTPTVVFVVGVLVVIAVIVAVVAS